MTPFLAFSRGCHAERSRAIRAERIGLRSRSTTTHAGALRSAEVGFMNASWIGSSDPPWLKPGFLPALIGAAEAVPFPAFDRNLSDFRRKENTR